MFSKILVVLVVLLVLVLGVLGLLTFLATRPSELVGNRPTVVASAEGARRFDARVSDIERQIADARQSGQRANISAVFTDEELTSEAARLIAEQTGGATIRDIQIHSTPNGPIASGIVNVQGFDVTVALQLSVDVVSGQPLVAVQRVDVGSLPLPGAIVDQVKNSIAQSLDLSTVEMPFELLSIQFTEGQATVQGQLR